MPTWWIEIPAAVLAVAVFLRLCTLQGQADELRTRASELRRASEERAAARARELAESLGISEDELRERTRNGRPISG